MPETLLSPSNILLFGRELADIVVRHVDKCPPDDCDGKKLTEQEIHQPFVEPRGGVNRFLDQQLENKESRLARIYGFSFEGYYYDLARPVIFLVHGDGASAEDVALPAPRDSRAPSQADLSGAGAQGYSFPEDMRVWSYDKGDFSIRLDVETGSFDEILLGPECGDGPGVAYSGMHARVKTSGMHARIRTSGMHARSRGRDGGGSD